MPDSNALLPINHPLHAEIVQFLFHEADLLDTRRFSEWIELLAADMTYRVPLRNGTEHTGEPSNGMLDWYDDDLEAIRSRISRLATEFAYAEQPPSQTRHMITNIRVWSTSTPGQYDVASNILVNRYRGSQTTADVFCGERRDVVRKGDQAWRLAKRTVFLDQRVIGTGSIGIFL